jgi:hypothetical protein
VGEKSPCSTRKPSGPGPPWFAMYSAITWSVTLPLLQQKYPRAHTGRPQNSFRCGANSCGSLYAVFPSSRCTSRLIVTRGGIDSSRCTWPLLTCPFRMCTSAAPQVSRISSRSRSPTAPTRTASRYLVVQTRCRWISKALWAPRRYSSMGPILPPSRAKAVA